MKITLRKPRKSDVKDFQEVFNDPEVARQLVGFPYPMDLEKARIKLQETIDLNKKGDYYESAIVVDGKFVGMIVLEKPSKDKKTFTLGYVIGRKYWNKGIITICIKRMLDFGFNKLKLKKIVADNDESNPSSGRVLEKNGFRLVKTAKKRGVNVLFWEMVR
jgi:[ribosomal protein S5]-alanine N-acetyltransferase